MNNHDKKIIMKANELMIGDSKPPTICTMCAHFANDRFCALTMAIPTPNIIKCDEFELDKSIGILTIVKQDKK